MLFRLLTILPCVVEIKYITEKVEKEYVQNLIGKLNDLIKVAIRDTLKNYSVNPKIRIQAIPVSIENQMGMASIEIYIKLQGPEWKGYTNDNRSRLTKMLSTMVGKLGVMRSY